MNDTPILLCGFEPFGGDAVNPSWDVARNLDGARIAGARVAALCLPCVFGDALRVLRTAIGRHRPGVVLCLGLAASRQGLSLERVAINVDDARIPDNAGQQPVDLPVVPGGPAAYFTRLPIKAIAQALRDAGLPAEVSQTAGTFVCNHVFYGLLHQLRRRPRVRAGFMHLPLSPEMRPGESAGRSGLALSEQIRGVRLALEVALVRSDDLALPGGAVD